ncbi:MAG: DUF4446 family protein [Clostridia bacterium]
MLAFLRTDGFICFIGISMIILCILYIINTIRLFKLRKNYKEFMSKLGNGDNIEDCLKKYIKEVEAIKIENQQIENYCTKIDKKISNCIQKVGIVRYNAFKDTGSDLSFAVALLNEEHDGIVLNGIYSREMSNIYAKPIKNGQSTYTLSEEEQQSIQKAIENKEMH